MGGFDQALWQAKRFIKNNHIEFQPGVNEDLAATALWGTQQIHLYPGARYDGVFGMWYGKGPGVDRSGDVLKHANYAGTARHGGIVALAGDDHMAKSSTTAHQSEPALIAAAIPIIHAASVQEYLDLGLHAFALSRYSGLWVAFKVLSETVDSSASVHVDPHRIDIQIPTDFVLPPDGVHIRWPDDWLGQERRTLTIKHPAALAYWRANKLDRLMMGRPDARFGIVTVGKSYLDVRQALDELGIDDAEAERLGLAVYKVAMVWPLETEGVTAFAQGKREILVVEEKRPIIEQQLKDALFNAPADRRPVVVGKTDERGQKLLKIDGELTPFEIASVLVARFGLEGLERSHQAALGSPAAPQPAGRCATNRAWRACPTSAPAARTTPRPRCPKARWRWPASAVTRSPSTWSATPRPSPTWAPRARPGSAPTTSPTCRTSSRTWATAPTSIPATWRSATPSRPTPPSPTRSSTTTPSP